MAARVCARHYSICDLFGNKGQCGGSFSPTGDFERIEITSNPNPVVEMSPRKGRMAAALKQPRSKRATPPWLPEREDPSTRPGSAGSGYE